MAGPGQVVVSFQVEMLPAAVDGSEPPAGVYTDFSRELYDSGLKIAAEEVDDTRTGAKVKEMIAGLITASQSLGIRSDLEDPLGLCTFLETNFRKRIWVKFKPRGATSNLVYKFAQLVSKLAKIGGAVGAHSAEDTLEQNCVTQPQVSRDNGVTWTLIGG